MRAGSGSSGFRRRMRLGGWRTGLLTCVPALGLVLLMLVWSVESGPRSGPSSRSGTDVVAALPFWNLERGRSAVLRHSRVFSEVSPWIYGLDSRGGVVSQVPAERAAAANSLVNRMRDTRLRITPTVANMTDGRWSYEAVAPVLHDPRRRREHVREVVDLVLRNDYAGVDIDYEELRASDRAAFSALVRQLAAALHAHDRSLSVAVFAKASRNGYDERNVAQDYAAIGRFADQVRLMGYDRHWSTSAPGPVAPVDWVREVVAYARDTIPAHKIVLGVPLYGYDWSGGRGEPVTWAEAMRLVREHDVGVRFDEQSATPWFRYTDAEGNGHEVWFENATSSRAKFEVADRAGIGGVYLWMYGAADPGTWTRLRHVFSRGEEGR